MFQLMNKQLLESHENDQIILNLSVKPLSIL